MRGALTKVADKLVQRVVPKADAGACACGDCWLGPCGSPCASNRRPRYCSNCNCSKTWVNSCNAC